MSHTGTWTYFLNKLERSVVAYTRQELDEANVERSRRSSACDAVKTIKTTVNAMKCKLQVRSLESIEEFCSLAEQFVDNSCRSVATDVVLHRVLGGSFTSSDQQRREHIVTAIQT